jgi:hypothetical protein
MEITQKAVVRSFGALLLILSAVFVCVPLIVGGHPGEAAQASQQSIHLW